MAVTKAEIARHLGADPSLVGRWCRRGMPTSSLSDALTWHAANIRPTSRGLHRQVAGPAPRHEPPRAAPAAEPAEPAAAGATPRTLTARLLAARVEREEFSALQEARRAQLQAGELCLVADVERETIAVATALREALRNVGPRVGPLLAAESEPGRCAALVDQEIDAALQALRQSRWGRLHD